VLRVFFVSSESWIKDDLMIGLQSNHKNWECRFFDDTHTLLSAVAEQDPDVVVATLEQNGTSGVSVVKQLADSEAEAQRVLVIPKSRSAESISHLALQHCIIQGPCEPCDLTDAIQRGLQIKILIGRPEVARAVSQLTSLPVFPETFYQVEQVLKRESYELGELVSIIECDPAMVTQTLRVANSALFAFNHEVTEIGTALALLGIQRIKSLILVHELFAQVDKSLYRKFDLDKMWQRGMRVGSRCQQLSEMLGVSGEQKAMAFNAGLIHEIGKLAMMCSRPDDYKTVLDCWDCVSIEDLLRQEKTSFGADHTEIGAYLLHLWGLPTALVEALLFQWKPPLEKKEVQLPLLLFLAHHLSGRGGGSLQEELIERVVASYGLIEQWSELSKS